jgi:hypothetical protein
LTRGSSSGGVADGRTGTNELEEALSAGGLELGLAAEGPCGGVAVVTLSGAVAETPAGFAEAAASAFGRRPAAPCLGGGDWMTNVNSLAGPDATCVATGAGEVALAASAVTLAGAGGVSGVTCDAGR